MEPVDFSGPPRPLGFGLVGHISGPRPYSRESTPDSGGSHYIETYRDPSGKWKVALSVCLEDLQRYLALSLSLQATPRIPATVWSCSPTTRRRVIMAMDRPHINAVIHMPQPSVLAVIRHPSPAATRPVRPPATRCHRRSTYRSTTRPRMGKFLPTCSFLLMKYAIIKADTLSSSTGWVPCALTHSLIAQRRVCGTWHSGCSTFFYLLNYFC